MTHVKYYADTEKSRAGASKKDWRLVLLQGDATFMTSLEQFEAEHRFWVGSDRIIIRGGNRRTSQSGPGSRGAGRQQQQQQQQARGQRQQQQQQQQQQQNQNQNQTGGLSRGHVGNSSYNTDFPSNLPNGGRSSSDSRGGGSGQRRAGVIRGAPMWGEASRTRGGSH